MNKLNFVGSLFVIGLLGTGCVASTRTADQYREDTAKVFAAKDPELQACYAEVRKAEPEAKGNVTVDFSWNLAGAPRDSRIPGEIKIVAAKSNGSPALKDCALKTVKSAVLTPDGKGYGHATWTFTFDKNGATSAPATPVSAPATGSGAGVSGALKI